ncbi:MAG: hypothetical protein HY22_08480 [[Candidatus Thermochlorobacteriaceae] bacterium GBChlB]|nr:MAG: hypothetical protein HY22_08480 [[Candidatus Thermochlorobacteriaceae] bacterium GBChlB]
MSDKITVVIDKELRDLVPDFLQRRIDDVETIKSALTSGDFRTIETLGHNMKGSGAGYGFREISRIGAEIEAEAIARRTETIMACLQALEHFVKHVHVEYESL